ncbi:zf-TFIIB domain-containing protein [Agromyces sp. NPDC058484]|uniref:TFIIB-type zinc ribbon-containing protein n=1 Tax=Agromyces sp. NPDC058484 TaxID=3346524 RepID=UPI00365F9CB9
MQCPSDGTVLVMSERSGIEIDYCPTCRGVWLDRGELDKIVERGAREYGDRAQAAPPAAPPAPPQAPAYGQQAYPQQSYDNRGHDNRGYGDQGYYRKKKKESWLSELFD